MTLYLDTSLVVAALTSEAASSRIQAWLSLQTPGDLAISDWVEAEFSAALSIKLRARQMTSADRVAALTGFHLLKARSFAILPFEVLRFHEAAKLADRYDLGLRAGDALHLAIAGSLGVTLCTLDQRLAAAGPPLGIGTALV